MSNYILSAALELKDKFSSQIKTASSSFKNLSSQIKTESNSIKSSLKDLGNQFGITSKGAISGFGTVERYGKIATAATTAFAGKSYLGWVDLEDQLLRNAAITGANIEEQERLNEQITQLGRTTRFTSKEVAESQMYLAMSGKSVNETLEITPTLLKMAIASGDDLATTSNYLTNSMTAAGIGIKDTTRYADLLANMSMRTNTTMSEMADTVLKIGSLTKGQEKIEDIATAMGILADNGIKGAEAGTAMKSIYAKLFQAQDDKKMKQLFKKYNLNLYKEVIGKDGKKHIQWKGLLEIIEDMKPAFQNMNAAEQNYFLTTVAGAHHMDAFSNLLKASNEQLNKARYAANNAEGSLEKFYNTMTSGSKQTLEEFKSALDGFSKAFGKSLSPIIDEKLKEMTSAINEVTETQLSTENIDKYIDHIILRAKQAAGVYVGLKSTIAAASSGATILGLGAGTVTALTLGGTALTGWASNQLRDKYMNSFFYQGDYMAKLGESRYVQYLKHQEELKNKSYLKTGLPPTKLGFENGMKSSIGQTKIDTSNIDISGLTVNITETTQLENIDNLVEKIQNKVGEKLKLKLVEAYNLQQ
ncbi:phage tail tape measure protein [Fusobacterium varium]